VSLDRRLRNELHRDADRIVPDVERNLGAVEASVRRRQGVGWPMILAATAVIALAVGLRLAPSAVVPAGASPVPSPTVGPSPSGMVASLPATFDAISGTYSVTLAAADPAVAQYRIGGTWTMRLVADGEIFLSPPASFGSGTTSLSGLAFSLAADRFRSNIFYNDYCSSIGTYTWSLAGGRLSFAPVDDACAIRRALLATTPWQIGP
jgi:hypothetical protein